MKQTPEAEADQNGLALLAWIILLCIITVLGVLQVISFLKFGRMDVGIYYDAAMALRTGNDMFAVYNQPPLTYIYPPLFAILFMPLTYFPVEQAAAIWTVINVGLLLGCLWLGGWELIRRFDARKDAATLPVVMLLAVLIFLPRIRAELDQGQVDFLVLMAVTLGLVLIRRYPFWAGVVLGVIANIKYQTVIFLPYFVVRGWWTAGLGVVVGAVGAALSGAFVIGWSLNLDYLRRAFAGLGGILGDPSTDGSLPYVIEISWAGSLSLTSTFARWSEALGIGEVGMVVLVALALLICFLIGWFLYAQSGNNLFRGRYGSVGRTEKSQQPLIALEWAGLLIAALAFAPQTKMRHLALLLLVVMLVVLLLVVQKKDVMRWPLLLATIGTTLALILPPGAPEEMAELRVTWRAMGGPTWFLLLLYFTMLWTGLRWISLDRLGALSAK